MAMSSKKLVSIKITHDVCEALKKFGAKQETPLNRQQSADVLLRRSLKAAGLEKELAK